MGDKQNVYVGQYVTYIDDIKNTTLIYASVNKSKVFDALRINNESFDYMLPILYDCEIKTNHYLITKF